MFSSAIRVLTKGTQVELTTTWGDVVGTFVSAEEDHVVLLRTEHREITQPSTTVVDGQPQPPEKIKEVIEIEITLRMEDIRAFSVIKRKVQV